jgi:3-hydroxyisobutyrate dehydrogenase-like beta-hydroxyacid dehydrogenase
MNTSVCVLGLGLMGRPAARRLLSAGLQVRGWNRSPLPQHLKAGVPLCRDLHEASGSDILLFLLSDSAATDEVLSHLEPYLVAGRLVLDMGSSDPSHSKAHARRLAGKGIGWVDAPVSGGPEGAASGTLAIMAGGTEADVARAMPVLGALGRVVRVGGAGAGHTVKAINQIIVGLTIEAVAEALTLAEKCGVDPAVVQEALRGGFADSKILQVHGTRMINRTYTPGGRVRTHLKDARLGLALAAATGTRLPHLESVAARFEMLVAQGDGDLDHSALHKLLWNAAG